MKDLRQFKSFVKLVEPVWYVEGFTLIGYFPYEQAGIYSGPRLPRNMFSSLKAEMPRSIVDNKAVYVFVSEESMNDNFAVFYKDFHMTIGKWDDVVGYAGSELK